MAFQKPTKLAEWNSGLSNQTEPAAGKKTTGWTVNEAPASSFMNWLQYTAYTWFRWVDERMADGDLVGGNQEDLTIRPPANPTGNGGNITIAGRDANASGGGVGGRCTLEGGNAAGTDEDAGGVYISTGESTGTGYGVMQFFVAEQGGSGSTPNGDDLWLTFDGSTTLATLVRPLVVTAAGVYAGITTTGGSGNKEGLRATGGTTNGDGIICTGSGAGKGITATGGSANGTGAVITGGGTTSDGLQASGGSATGRGGVFTGKGVSAGINATGGSSGGTGGVFNGGPTNGSGVSATADGTGTGAIAVGGDDSGTGGSFTGGATNGKGLVVTGTGTGTGIEVDGGTGTSTHGIDAKSNSNGGYAIYARALVAGSRAAYFSGGTSSSSTVRLLAGAGIGMQASGGSTTIDVTNGGSSSKGIKVERQGSSGYALSVENDGAISPNQATFHLEPIAAQPLGPSLVGDMYVTTAGVLRICTVAGTPGTWVNV